MPEFPEGDWEIEGVADICGLSQLPENVRGTLDAERFATFYDADADRVLLVPTGQIDPDDVDAADSPLETREVALSKIRESLAAARRVPGAALDQEKAEEFSDVVDGLVSLERQFQNEVEQRRSAGGQDDG